MIWYIEKVYTAQGRTSSNERLLRALHTELTEMFDADRHFSHVISRWPFYTGDDLTAYRWHNQHHNVANMKKMIQEVRAIMGKTASAPPKKLTKSNTVQGGNVLRQPEPLPPKVACLLN
ncbi:replication initiation protein [Corynebacterium kroppenstedtii]|jgi:rep protein|uniref:replication initiation protein n=1 Tax=Corynebacterium kroppenstedtii TaxID=161879 RepID=UPI0026B1E3B4|nr:replication initiation protein [Corynebacterium kroppenstedtii]MDU7287725.1 replication initiation protein [Corynebacterium kroppenstedtii]